jgi:hypothetical protein
MESFFTQGQMLAINELYGNPIERDCSGSPLYRDASFNPMENGQYFLFMIDCTNALNTIYHLNVSIYTDGSGNNYALDSIGNIIKDRLIANITYSYPYINSDTQQYITGFMTLTFDDGTTFTNDDEHEESFWYSLQGMDQLGIKQFT